MPSVRISIYHDCRRKKVSGLYPVKLRVYYDNDRRDYGIYQDKDKEAKIDLSKEDYQKVMFSERPRDEQKALRRLITAVQERAQLIVDKMASFSFDAFNRRYAGAIGLDNDIIHQYSRYIAYLEKQERYGTASNYELSLKSIIAYQKHITGREVKNLPFNTITAGWLEGYEKHMLSTPKNPKKPERGTYSKATIGIYLRPLRAMFNYAIDPIDYTADKKQRLEPIIDKEVYPFGEKLYVMPSAGKVKKALDMEQLGKLYNHVLPEDSEQLKARDFWFFSYAGNGMNMRDIALLRKRNIQGDVLVFERAKTKRTTKADPIKITVPIIDHIKHVIDKYGTSSSDPNAYLFPILNTDMKPKQQRIKAMAFTRFVNQHMKNLAKTVGVTDDISSNWGRHSFTTNAIHGGAPIGMIKESLGHKNLKTTEGYVGSFANSKLVEIAKGLMNFNNTENE